MITKKQIEKFVKVRNRAMHHTNLQFQIDATACGFDPKDLGTVRKEPWQDHPEFHDYVWDLPCGELREHRGLLTFTPK